MIRQFVISIMSRNRVGIVYEVSRAIDSLAGDIADISQTVLAGYFTMILHASFPPEVTVEAIRQTIVQASPDGATSLEIAVKEVPPGDIIEAEADPKNSYILTASGQNRIGFVTTVAAFCVQNDINILDLATLVAGETYIMILQVDLSQCEPVEAIQRRLKAFSQETGLNTALQHYDIFRATHEVTHR